MREMQFIGRPNFRDLDVQQEGETNKNTSPSPLTGGFKDSSKTSEDDTKNDEEKSTVHLFQKSSGKKNDSNKGVSNDNKADRHDKGTRGVNVLKNVNTYFTTTMSFKTYQLTVRSQEFNGQSSGKTAE